MSNPAVTEEVTGTDVVKSQILVTQGYPLSDPEIDLGDQSKIKTTGFALQVSSQPHRRP
ncbi:MAG: hypothetical protein R3C11_19240 [Planctomycetaceae bacterium]